jgi:hypothetical protein
MYIDGASVNHSETEAGCYSLDCLNAVCMFMFGEGSVVMI